MYAPECGVATDGLQARALFCLASVRMPPEQATGARLTSHMTFKRRKPPAPQSIENSLRIVSEIGQPSS